MLDLVLVILVGKDAPRLLWLVGQQVAAFDVVVDHHHHDSEQPVVHKAPELLDVVQQTEHQGVSLLLPAEPRIKPLVVFDVLLKVIGFMLELVLLLAAKQILRQYLAHVQ